MHGIPICCVFKYILVYSFYPNHCGDGFLAAVLLPGATALVLSSDTADTVAFVSHFPRALYGSQELYICWGTMQLVRGLRERGLEQRWALRGQDVIVCSSRAARHGSVKDTAEEDFRSQRAACDSLILILRHTELHVTLSFSALQQPLLMNLSPLAFYFILKLFVHV